MLCCDVSHKVLRTQTAYDLIKDIIAQKLPDMQAAVTKSLLGAVILTRYNNKCYRVDDIDWTMTPSSKFTDHTGEEKSFMDYYKKQYNIAISASGRSRDRKPAPPLCLASFLTYSLHITPSHPPHHCTGAWARLDAGSRSAWVKGAHVPICTPRASPAAGPAAPGPPPAPGPPRRSRGRGRRRGRRPCRAPAQSTRAQTRSHTVHSACVLHWCLECLPLAAPSQFMG